MRYYRDLRRGRAGTLVKKNVPLIDRQVKFINTRPRGRLGKKGYIYKNVGIFNGRFNRRLSTFFDMWHSRSRSSFLVALFPVGCRPRNPESQRRPTLPTALPSHRRFRGCGGSGTRVGRRRLSTTPGYFPAAPSSSPSLLASCFTPSVGREGTQGEERDEKRGGGGERERKKGEKNWWKFRGEGKEAEEKRGGRRCRGLILRPPIGSLATGSPTFAANRLSPRWLTSIVLERV